MPQRSMLKIYKFRQLFSEEKLRKMSEELFNYLRRFPSDALINCRISRPTLRVIVSKPSSIIAFLSTQEQSWLINSDNVMWNYCCMSFSIGGKRLTKKKHRVFKMTIISCSEVRESRLSANQALFQCSTPLGSVYKNCFLLQPLTDIILCQPRLARKKQKWIKSTIILRHSPPADRQVIKNTFFSYLQKNNHFEINLKCGLLFVLYKATTPKNETKLMSCCCSEHLNNLHSSFWDCWSLLRLKRDSSSHVGETINKRWEDKKIQNSFLSLRIIILFRNIRTDRTVEIFRKRHSFHSTLKFVFIVHGLNQLLSYKTTYGRSNFCVNFPLWCSS